MTVAEPREQCFELFRTQNSQHFSGIRPWTPLGKAYSAPPPPQSPQLHIGFSPRYPRSKTDIQKYCWMRH